MSTERECWTIVKIGRGYGVHNGIQFGRTESHAIEATTNAEIRSEIERCFGGDNDTVVVFAFNNHGNYKLETQECWTDANQLALLNYWKEHGDKIVRKKWHDD